MKNILVIGAGRSTSYLFKYLLDNAQVEDWFFRVCDENQELAKQKVENHSRAEAVYFDIYNDDARKFFIGESDLVISMLPAHMHAIIAKECVLQKTHMVTASYISAEIQSLNYEAQKAGIVLMNEIGVDPGIDHMSAMQIIDDVRNLGGKILQFETFTGGLLSPDSEKDNPWKYKFTWNPRNVVLAGYGGAVKFIQEGKYKYIPYHQLFRRTEQIEIDRYGKFEGYANRDSLKYRSIYGLDDIPTIYRGTLRRPGFCRTWDVFVKLGATDDSYMIDDLDYMTHRDFINLFLAYNLHDSVELKLMHYLKIDQDSDIMEKLEWLGMFEHTLIGLKRGTPAQVLEHILMKKWSLAPKDKDMIVMYHKIGYEIKGKKEQIESSMVCLGKDQTYTAMSKTVGLPVAIASKMILKQKISKPGVHLPITKDIYQPILKELQKFDIHFNEVYGPFIGY